MSKILFLGDSGATGFGSVTRDLGRALIDLGEDVRFVSQQASEEKLAEPFYSRTVLATSLLEVIDSLNGRSGVAGSTNVIADLLNGTSFNVMANGEPLGDWKPDACILLGDFTAARMMVMPYWDTFAQMRGRLFHYIPIEGVQLPPFWAQLWSILTPVAMSEFGADEIAKVMGTRPPVVYHGVDTDAFHPATTRNPVVIAPEGAAPASLESKDDCKRIWAMWFEMKMPRKWILRADANMPRKRYNSLVRPMAQVLYAHPDIALILHTQQFDQGGYLPDMLSKIPGARPLTNGMNEDPPKADAWALFGRTVPQVVMTNAVGMARQALVSLYNAADLYVSTSAEGFGLTIAESIACGVPAVGLEFSSVPEVIGPAGVTVPISYLLENPYDHYWAAIDEPKLAEQVEYLMTRPTRRERLGRKGPEHVKTNFQWSTAAQQFADLVHAAVTQEVAA